MLPFYSFFNFISSIPYPLLFPTVLVSLPSSHFFHYLTYLDPFVYHLNHYLLAYSTLFLCAGTVPIQQTSNPNQFNHLPSLPLHTQTLHFTVRCHHKPMVSNLSWPPTLLGSMSLIRSLSIIVYHSFSANDLISYFTDQLEVISHQT